MDLTPLLDLFVRIFHADKRPEARQITIGCLLVILLAIGTFWAIANLIGWL